MSGLARMLRVLLEEAKSQQGYVPGLSSVSVRIDLREGEAENEWVWNDCGEPSYPGLVVFIETTEKPTGRWGYTVLDPKLLNHLGDDSDREVATAIDLKCDALLRLKR